MIDYKCKICGGKLNISVNSGYAECGSCGNVTEIGPAELDKIRAVYESAGRKIRLNSAAGYREAINQLQTVSFAVEAREQIAFCEKRLAEMKAAAEKRAQAKEQTDKNNSVIGIIILILFLLAIALAVAGAVYIAVHLYRGDLSPGAVAAIVSAVVIFAAVAIIGKARY